MFFQNLFLMMALAIAGGTQHSMAQNNGSLPTVDDALRRHNIQLTQSSLVGALKNSDPEVRYLAAQKLAETKTPEVIPAIVEALTSEKTPIARMNIAFALAQLGEAKGFDVLDENGCGNRDLTAGIRLQSAEYMLVLHRESAFCLNALLEILQSESNGYKIQAASTLPKFHNVSPEDAQRVFAGLFKALASAQPSVRMAASQAITDGGNIAALHELP